MRFLETECVGSLEFAKTSLCTTLSRGQTKFQMCSFVVSGTKNDLGTLVVCQSPYPNALPCLSRNKFFVTSLGPTASMSSICTTNANVQFRVRKQTRIVLILNEAVFFQVARQVFLPASRRCSKTQHGLAQIPHHTSAVLDLQVAVHTGSPSRTSALRKACV